MPALEPRLSIAIKSGMAAKVVPKPATKPRTSDRLRLGSSKLCVSCGTRSSQPQSATMHGRKTASVTLLNLESVHTYLPTLMASDITLSRGEERDAFMAVELALKGREPLRDNVNHRLRRVRQDWRRTPLEVCRHCAS